MILSAKPMTAKSSIFPYPGVKSNNRSTGDTKYNKAPTIFPILQMKK